MKGSDITMDNIKLGMNYLFSMFLGYLLILYKLLIINISNNECGQLFYIIQFCCSCRPYITIEEDSSDDSSDDSGEEDDDPGSEFSEQESGYNSSNNLINFIKRLDVSVNNSNCVNTGAFFISAAFVFGNKGNKFFIEHVHNKLSLWCMVYKDLYINDIITMLGNKYKDLSSKKNLYFFIIATDSTGKSYKCLINITKKINVITKKPVMFSKITLRD